MEQGRLLVGVAEQTTPPSNPWWVLTDDDIGVIADNNWGVNIELSFVGLQVVESCQSCIDFIEHIYDCDPTVPVWVMLERPFGYGNLTHYENAEYSGAGSVNGREVLVPVYGPSVGVPYGVDGINDSWGLTYDPLAGAGVQQSWYHTNWGGGTWWPFLYWDTPETEYEIRFGTCMDMLEASHCVGYNWERAFDNGVSWLRERTSKLLMQYWHLVDITSGNPNYLGQTNGLAWRFTHTDSAMVEVYGTITAELSDAVGVVEYLAANQPTKPWGITTFYGDGSWWGTTDVQQQQQQIRDGLWKLRRYINKAPQVVESLGSSPASERVKFFESLDLTENDGVTKPVQQLSQAGFIPYYLGAAICTYPATSPLVDTFTNTGNEIIMLKSYSGSTTHTITVSGTLPNGLTTTQSYTRTLSSTQGTPIGPFPVDQFGYSPTITYDNTNLYVAIIGAWRTGFEPL